MPGRPGPRLLRWDRAVFAAAVAILVVGVWRDGMDPDDQVQLDAILRQPLLEGARAPFDLYDFGHIHDDEAADLQRGRDLTYRGAVKWCQAPLPLRVAFFRPVSSA